MRLTVALIACLCLGQGLPSHRVLIHLPPEVASENVIIRYVLAGQKFGGWVQATSGASSYAVDTTVGNTPAKEIKAIIYAPGCAIDTLDLPLSKVRDEEFSFSCKPLESTSITGRIVEADTLYRHGVTLEARYVARWAHRFLGLADDSVLVFPVGNPAELSSDGRFRISVPDFSRDPRAAENDGEMQIFAKDKSGQNLLAQVIPSGTLSTQVAPTRMGGFRIRGEYPSEFVFAPCAVNRAALVDENGFAHRSDIDGCRK